MHPHLRVLKRWFVHQLRRMAPEITDRSARRRRRFNERRTRLRDALVRVSP